MGLCLGWDWTGLVYVLPTTVNSDVQLSRWGSCYKLVQQVLKKKEGETTKRTVVSIPLSQKWFVITSFTLLGSTSFSKLFLEIEFASVVSPKRRLLPSVKVQGERQAVNLRAGPSCTLLGLYQLFPILEQKLFSSSTASQSWRMRFALEQTSWLNHLVWLTGQGLPTVHLEAMDLFRS